MTGASKTMEQLTLNPRALEAYLRFSYPLGYAPFPGQENVPYPEIRFTSVPGRAKEDYLKELSRILEDIFETERQYSDAAFLSSGVDSSVREKPFLWHMKNRRLTNPPWQCTLRKNLAVSIIL